MIPTIEDILHNLLSGECTFAQAQTWIEQHIAQERSGADRDWFAGRALTGLVAAIPGPGCADWNYYGEAAYHIADAMLKAREE